jgi:hypothetical protein
VLAALRRLERGAASMPRALAWLASALWMAAIWWLSSDARDLGGSGPAWGLAANAAHAPLFAGLAILLASALAPRTGPRGSRVARAAALAIAVAWGVTDEWHQSWVPGRHASPFDLATDATGAAVALWLVAYAGSADAREPGARRRAFAALAACAVAAAAATCSGA